MIINFLNFLINNIYSIKTKYRITLLIFFDFLLLFLCTRTIFYLSNIIYTGFNSIILLISIPTFILTDQYKGLTKYNDSKIIYEVTLRNSLVVIISLLISNLLDFESPNRIQLFLLLILFSFSMISSRILIKDILSSSNHSAKKKSVLIYGAGAAGAMLQASLKLENNHIIRAFIDDDPNLWGRNINGIPIISYENINKLEDNIDQLLLAIPSLNTSQKKAIFTKLRKLSIPILQVPSVQEIVSGRISISSFRPINIEDILQRDIVKPNNTLVKQSVKDKAICVTGAAGSIGSELCKQILKIGPSRLVMIDMSEVSLYKLQEELTSQNFNISNSDFVLGDVCDYKLVADIFKNKKIEIVFHSSAYKHVPIVEANPIQGIKNNYFSTKVICQAAKEFYLQKVILISSDKAVRPTNIMGASKRLSELIFQESEKENKQRTPIFSMVRFGNVLNSSGSVVPLFKKQISNGGPITLTDKRITRYFMAIKEASLLVLQASSLANGGEVFLLEMGKPILIYELAKQMIRLSGLKLKNQKNPDGDIEIINTGLRPGEKLYEELLIDAKSESTIHPLIYKAKEKSSFTSDFLTYTEKLEEAIGYRDIDKVFYYLNKLVPEWTNCKI